MRSKYHGRIQEMAENLFELYEMETSDADVENGARWYDKAHAIMAEWSESYGYSIATCAAVTAAISPQCEWERNLIIADDILAGRPAVSIGGALHANLDKARFLRDYRLSDPCAAFKSAPKVCAFARNLAGDFSAVTVDTHATQAALADVTVTVGLNAAKYEAFAEAYAMAADAVLLQRATFQAIIWHTWKRLHPRVEKTLVRKAHNRARKAARLSA